MKQQTTHGGPGRGQGRHAKLESEKFVPCGLRLPPDVDKWLRENITGNRSGFIVEAIREKIDKEISTK